MKTLLCITIGIGSLLTAVVEAGIKPVITAPRGTTGGSIPIRVTFTHKGFPTPVTDFAANDVTVTNGSLSDFSGSGHTYNFKVSPTAKEFSVSVDANAATNRFSILG
ncbi:MAG: Ig-like domain-containing protein, partial [Opitutales bacterium]